MNWRLLVLRGWSNSRPTCGSPESLPLGQRVALDRWPNEAYVAFDLIAPLSRAEARALPDVLVDWPSETGLTLVGYSLGGPMLAGGTAELTSYWLVDQLVESRHNFIFGPYFHLVSGSGEVVVNGSGSGLEGYYYAADDLYIQTTRADIPQNAAPGAYTLELGLFDGVHLAGTMFYPPAGEPQPFYAAPIDVHS